MKPVRATLACLIPFCAGPVIMPTIPPGELGAEYLHRSIIFFLLFGTVEGLQWLIGRFYSSRGARSKAEGGEAGGRSVKRPLIHRWQELIEILLIVGGVFLAFVWLQLFRSANPPEVFYLVLAAIFLRSSAVRLDAVQRPLTGAGAYLLGSAAVAYLSIQLTTGAWLVQPILISLGIGAAAAAPRLAGLIEREPTAPPKRRTVYARLCIAFTALGPVLFGALVTVRQLGSLYLFTFLVLAVMRKEFEELAAYEESGAPPNRLAAVTASAALLFVAIALAVGIHYT